MVHQYYIYHKILSYVAEHKGKAIEPYKEIIANDPNVNIQPKEMIPIIDQLENEGLISTNKGYGIEHKKISANELTFQFLKNGGYLNSEDKKIHEILRFLTEQVNKNTSKHSFNSDEIWTTLFKNELNLPIALGEVNFLLRKLIEEEDLIDVTSNDNHGTKGIMVTDDTESAYHGKKYLDNEQFGTISQTVNIQNYQSNEGTIQGNQTFDNHSNSEEKKGSGKIIGIFGIILAVIAIVVSILIAKGII